MLCNLVLHPDYLCPPVSKIAVEIQRWRDLRLDLRYCIFGDTAALQIPAQGAAVRTDDLWKNLCVEAFVRPRGSSAYREINLSPSSAWAAYSFSDYRAGMADAPIAAPDIKTICTPDCLELSATITFDLPQADLWHIGLSAVIELAGGDKSYWALRHPPGKADFHHDHGFALSFSSQSQSGNPL